MASFILITESNFKNEILINAAIKLNIDAYLLFFAINTHVIIKKGFASQVDAAPPVKAPSQPISKTPKELAHPSAVQ